MILGMSFSTFTLFHVILSLVGIGTGLVVLIGMFVSRKLEAWTALFLGTTVLTSVTGYFFPFDQILPSHIVGAVSLVVLAIALYALYARHLAAHWRWIYVVARSEEHTSELQSPDHLVCRLLLEKKKKITAECDLEFRCVSCEVIAP